MAETRRVLVTGGSGFIGTHLLAKLMDSGGRVSSIDLAPPKIVSHQPVWKRIDLLDEAALFAHIAAFRPDIIFNLAANADIGQGGSAFRVNTQGLRNIADASRAAGLAPHLIHASTQLVVRPGYQPAGPRDYAPYTEYGESKAESEELLWNEGADVFWTIVRPGTIWGPWHPGFPGSIWKYLEKRWYLLPSDPDPLRTYSYVGNAVAQLLAIPGAAREAVERQVFYIGDAPIRGSKWLDSFSIALSGHPVRRVPGWMLRALALAGEASKRLGGPAPIDLGRLYRMTTSYPVPLEPTFALLGTGPTSLEEGVAETVAWLRRDDPAAPSHV